MNNQMKKEKSDAKTAEVDRLVKQEHAEVVKAPVKSKVPAAAAMHVDPLGDDKQFADLEKELKQLFYEKKTINKSTSELDK